jgi:hypothetical protein
MPGTQHREGRDFLVDDTLTTGLEELLQEIVVLYTDDGRHQNVDLVTVNLESIVAE